MKKNETASLSDGLDQLLTLADTATPSASCAQRLREHILAMLLCPDKATVTNLICTAGEQQHDWSAPYRLYSHGRVDETVLFATARQQLEAQLGPGAALVVALDDTLVRKTGTKIDGVGWKRDPLGPPFQTNLVPAQRYLQFSAAWPLADGQARLVPIGFFHAPSAGKPPKDASPEQLREHREEQKQLRLNQQALVQMQALREQVAADRPIVFNGDGSYTNETVLKKLPVNTTYIGRIRKDAALHLLPAARAATGRPPSYGQEAPTPEQLRQDETIPWQPVEAFAAGQRHCFKIKTLAPVLWRKSGVERPLRVIVIAPLGYRLRKGAKLLYRQPAYIICTDPDLPIETVLQNYLWRWGIEVNFREEKSLLGAGEAQVRTAASNQHLPATVVAAYALLWIAALRSIQNGQQIPLVQPPKWRHPTDAALPSTGELLRRLRFELWAHALRPSSFHHFVTKPSSTTKPHKPLASPAGSLFAAA